MGMGGDRSGGEGKRPPRYRGLGSCGHVKGRVTWSKGEDNDCTLKEEGDEEGMWSGAGERGKEQGQGEGGTEEHHPTRMAASDAHRPCVAAGAEAVEDSVREKCLAAYMQSSMRWGGEGGWVRMARTRQCRSRARGRAQGGPPRRPSAPPRAARGTGRPDVWGKGVRVSTSLARCAHTPVIL